MQAVLTVSSFALMQCKVALVFLRVLVLVPLHILGLVFHSLNPQQL